MSAWDLPWLKSIFTPHFYLILEKSALAFFSHPLGLLNLGEFQEFFLHPTPAVRHKVIFLKWNSWNLKALEIAPLEGLYRACGWCCAVTHGSSKWWINARFHVGAGLSIGKLHELHATMWHALLSTISCSLPWAITSVWDYSGEQR